MNWQPIIDTATTFFVIFLIAFIIYTNLKKQTISDTWAEIVDVFTTVPEEPFNYYG